MESFAKLRRRHLVKGESISAIARDLNLSRNTVKKYLKADVGPAYRRQQQPSPKLGAFAEQLERWLVQDGLRPKRERRSAKRLFEDLQQAGYAGAYDSVQRFVKQWKRLLLDPWHYLLVLEKKPGALRHGAPFQDWALPAPLAAVKARLMQTPQGDRAFVEILLALQEHGMERVSVACELALEHRTVTAPVILNHVHRLASPVRPVPQVPTTLTLQTAPAAN